MYGLRGSQDEAFRIDKLFFENGSSHTPLRWRARVCRKNKLVNPTLFYTNNEEGNE